MNRMGIGACPAGQALDHVGRQVVEALSKAGFEIVGRKGSHIRLKKKTPIKHTL